MNCTYQITKIKYPEPEEVIIDRRFDQIIETVCTHFGLTFKEVCKRTRSQRIVIPRHILSTLLYVNCPVYSVEAIAYLYRQDHATVIHSVKTVKEKVDQNFFYDPLKDHYQQIVKKLPFEVDKIEKRSEKYMYGYKKIVS